MTDIPGEMRYYPFTSQLSASFSLEEAVAVVALKKGCPLTTREKLTVCDWLALLKEHEVVMYQQILDYRKARGGQ